MGSPYTEVKPMFMVMDPEWGGTITVRLAKNKEISVALPTVKSLFEKHNPAYPFDYTFADVAFAKKFKTINMTSSLGHSICLPGHTYYWVRFIRPCLLYSRTKNQGNWHS